MKRTLRPGPSPAAEKLREQAHRIIPAGVHTYSKGDDQFPANAPPFIRSGRGARVWDSDGAEFLDWGMGLRSVILGHAYPRVIDAVAAELPNGSNFVRASPLEVELAERLIELIPCAEMVKFAKNGSDVTTAAVRLARAATGRDLIVCADQPFFSVDDWFIGTTPVDAGIPRATKDLTLTFRYNSLDSLREVFGRRPGEVAAVILEPMTFEWPAPGFLEGVRELCSRSGTVLIFDEMITGFRFDLRGLQHRFGVIPDLATFGKSMANGFSVAALVGRRDIMDLGGIRHDRSRVFLLSTTHGGETHELAAAIATIAELGERGVAAHIWEIGAKLTTGFDALAAELGIASQVHAIGAPCSPSLAFADRTGASSPELRTLFMQELVARGILAPYLAPSLSHSAGDVATTLEAAGEALAVVKVALDDGVEGLLNGPAVRPVFRRFN
jgi:glutamate-1-semialdehyde 2,1-aminomutase